ncbi:MAG: alkaline phosphatase family protein, partial [Nanoarchaeota archaeon]
MILPDYDGGSIVNLMSSLSLSRGGKAFYPQLKLLPASALGAKNVVFIVIDGLGHRQLMDGRYPTLRRGLKGMMTSLFPSTTANCITMFHTGVTCQQHGLTGWWTYMKETGAITTPLRYTTRSGGHLRCPPEGLFVRRSVFDTMDARVFTVLHNDLKDTVFNKAHTGKAKRVGFTTLNGMFGAVKRIVRGRGRKYVYAYWSDVDKLNHHHGPQSTVARRHVNQIDRRRARLTDALRGTDTTIVVTADRGHALAKKILLKDHPRLEAMLSM